MTRTDLCPLFSHYASHAYIKMFCNHGYPCSNSFLERHPHLEWSECKEPDMDRCAFWNKCKRENNWID